MTTKLRTILLTAVGLALAVVVLVVAIQIQPESADGVEVQAASIERTTPEDHLPVIGLDSNEVDLTGAAPVAAPMPLQSAPIPAAKPQVASAPTSKPAPIERVLPRSKRAAPAVSSQSPSTTVDQRPVRERILSIAQGQVGKSGSYTAGGFWCAKFTSWVGTQAAVPGWAEDDSPMRQAYRQPKIAEPQPGDLVFIDLMGMDGTRGDVSHVGIVESVEGNTIKTIEGNADSSGVVTRQARAIGDGYVLWFGTFER